MSEFLSTVVMIVVMWFGGKLVLSGSSTLSPEEFIGYIAIFSQLIPPAKSFTSAYYFIQKGSASAARILQILDTKNDIKDGENAKCTCNEGYELLTDDNILMDTLPTWGKFSIYFKYWINKCSKTLLIFCLIKKKGFARKFRS